jgi:hypothetical protein
MNRGAHTQSRTGDLIITNDALYHLSYASNKTLQNTQSKTPKLERVAGIEPA